MPTTNIGLNLPVAGSSAWDVPTNANWNTLDGFFGTTAPYLVKVVAKVDATAQAANITTATLFASAPAGMYRAQIYTVVTQAATTSSTLPNGQIVYTDNDTNVSTTATLTATNTANTLGAVGAAGASNIAINVKAGTTIQYLTAGYASSGATPMQYAVHIKLEYLGS